MNTYLSTFISGLQKPVKQLLKENVSGLKIHLLLDGLVVYQTNENEFVSADKRLLARVENKIIGLKGIKLKVSPYRPQVEFWFLRRSENIGFFLLRLTKNTINKKLHTGELRPELAYILCSLSRTK